VVTNNFEWPQAFRYPSHDFSSEHMVCSMFLVYYAHLLCFGPSVLSMGECHCALTASFEGFGNTAVPLEWLNDHGACICYILHIVSCTKHIISPALPNMLTHISGRAGILGIKEPVDFHSATMSSTLKYVCDTSVNHLNLWDWLKKGIYG